MKYKVGDKVRVRKDLVVDRGYEYAVFVAGMKKYSGKIMTVASISSNNKYCLKEDAGKWHWTDEMLEDVEDISILVEGNKVIAKKGNKVGIAKCSPEDEFDIFTGARLAIDRLEEKCKSYGWLKEGVKYYVPAPTDNKLFDWYPYTDDDTDKMFISRGLVFKTEKEAIECAKKMLEVVK